MAAGPDGQAAVRNTAQPGSTPGDASNKHHVRPVLAKASVERREAPMPRRTGTNRPRAQRARAGLRLRTPPPRVQRPKTRPTRAQRRAALQREFPEVRVR